MNLQLRVPVSWPQLMLRTEHSTERILIRCKNHMKGICFLTAIWFSLEEIVEIVPLPPLPLSLPLLIFYYFILSPAPPLPPLLTSPPPLPRNTSFSAAEEYSGWSFPQQCLWLAFTTSYLGCDASSSPALLSSAYSENFRPPAQAPLPSSSPPPPPLHSTPLVARDSWEKDVFPDRLTFRLTWPRPTAA